ncbi:unnamed protein product [Heterobilharzia americana]|nr:unnamed protein product [Heterobilharzia americana]
MKAKVSMGTCNVRTVFGAGWQGCPDCKSVEKIWHRSARNLRNQMEWKWTLQTVNWRAESIIYSDIVTQMTTTSTLSFRVVIMMSSRASKTLRQWEPISSCRIRIMTARLNSKGRKVTIIQCYATHQQIMQIKRRRMNSTDNCNQHWTRLHSSW